MLALGRQPMLQGAAFRLSLVQPELVRPAADQFIILEKHAASLIPGHGDRGYTERIGGRFQGDGQIAALRETGLESAPVPLSAVAYQRIAALPVMRRPSP
ncbi:hypothetical protein GCM10011390_30250 [Aureimonas endophytica]|uniref:Uncharacterized protein n=1 Tax=Aureimonas endophytica TaxID=2027858 RepID=A0A916ZQK0_9HYPH|nr:hypothetical protein GCM10011390_30250 [Aureimonas endophytica]